MKILDRLPISSERTSPGFGDRYITLHRSQILVWVSILPAGVLEPEVNAPRLPALLDTGNNFGFSMRDRQLREWAGIRPELLKPLGEAQIEGQPVERRKAAVWLFPNMPGRREVSGSPPPFRLEMRKGIAIYPPEAIPPGPRLPLLGLPALLDNDLDCWLDPERRHVTVQTRSWRRRLIRLLCRL